MSTAFEAVSSIASRARSNASTGAETTCLKPSNAFSIASVGL